NEPSEPAAVASIDTPADPFLKLVPASQSTAKYAVQPAAFEEPAEPQAFTPPADDRYAAAPSTNLQPPSFPAETELARGQSPARREASSAPTSGNPLRRAEPIDTTYNDAEADAARRAFGEVLASGSPSAPRESAPLPLENLPSHEIPAAFNDEGPAAEPAPFAAAATNPPPVEPLPLEAAAPANLTPPPALDSFATPAAQPLENGPPQLNQLRAAPAIAEPMPPQPMQPPLESVVVERTPAYPAEPDVSSPPLPMSPPPAAATPPMMASAMPPTTPGAGRPGERAMEGRQQPSIAIEKFAPDEVQVGKAVKVYTKVRNMGQRPAVGVIVRDQTPAGSRLMVTTPRADVAGDQIFWDLGTLSPGEERTLEMELTPTEEGEIGSVATVSFAAQATARSRCTRPQLAIRMTAPSQVLVGRRQPVKIELHNPGTGDATGVMLLENVPENLRHEAGAALEFAVGTLRAGETRTLELEMVAEKAGHVTNVLTARADGNLEVQQQVKFEVVAPELAVGVHGPRRRYLERPATYTVSIENPGTAAAQDVRLVTRLPQGMRFVKANNLGEYDAATHSVYWSLAELPEGEQGHVKLTTLPVTSGELTLEVEGQANEGLKDQAAMAVQIEGIAALNFEVLDVEDPIEVGGETVYEVRVTNQGTKAATNVGVRFATPAGLRAVAASGEGRHSVQNGAVVFAPLERLAPQAEALFRVRVEGVQAGDQRMVVEVSSDDLGQPVRKEESTRVFGDE
ncbi:MAG: hypothetical protein AAF589_07155, partial [Planctomycetota bacterium]